MSALPRKETIQVVFDAVKRYASGSRDYCFASNESIATELSLSAWTVSRAISYLAIQKIIRVSMVPHPRGVERRIYVDADPVYDERDRELRSGATHIPTGEQPVQIPSYVPCHAYVGAPVKPLVYLRVRAGQTLHIARSNNPEKSICGRVGAPASLIRGSQLCAACAGKKARRELTDLGWQPHMITRPHLIRSGIIDIWSNLDKIVYVYRKSQEKQE